MLWSMPRNIRTIYCKRKGHRLQKRPDVIRRLERAYFRLQQTPYFVEQSADPNAKIIAGFARQYYQQLHASDGSDPRAADEYVKSTEADASAS